MLGIHGKEFNTLLFYERHDNVSAGDQGLFIGKCYILALHYRIISRKQAADADHGTYDRIDGI